MIITILALAACSSIEPMDIAVDDNVNSADQWEPSGTIDETDPDNEDGDEDGYTPNDGDCNDNNDAVNPGADEVCNGTDDDCDGVADENDVCEDGEEPAIDFDGDGYNEDVDCDDYDPNSYPGASEVCDDADNDCDGSTDEGDVCTDEEEPGPVDNDGDGYTEDVDCDDNDSNTHPGATEDCDGVDNDCDGDMNDEWNVCYATVYRHKSDSSETRCWSVNTTATPSYCDGYSYEREAFVIAKQQFDGNVKLYSCYTGADEGYWYDQIFTTDSSDRSALMSAGYICSTVGYTWDAGDGPATGLSPFSTCDVARYVWDESAGVGNGHVFTVADSTADLEYESHPFSVESNHTCTL